MKVILLWVAIAVFAYNQGDYNVVRFSLYLILAISIIKAINCLLGIVNEAMRRGLEKEKEN